MRIQASALYFALLAATLIALLLSSFLLLSKTQRIFQIKNLSILNSLEAVTQGLDMALSGTNYDAYSYNDRSVKIKQDAWGGFFLFEAQDTTDSFGLQKQALTGGIFKEPTSIVLKDNFLPLVVAGEARIEGTALLPERGVESAAIAGKYYLGEKLIFGNYRNVSSINFPRLDPKWLSKTDSLITTIPESGISLSTEIKKTFSGSVSHVFSTDPLWIDQNIGGQVIIQSSSTVNITKQANLSDALIIAPKVIIEDGVTARLHVMATDSILVGNQVDLKYPSSLVLIDKSGEEMTGNVSFIGEAKFGGNIIYYNSESNDEILNTNIGTNENTTIIGSIYANGAVELLGQLQGTLICYYTVANQNSQKYRNYIFNGRIITENLPRKIAGLPLENNPQTIAKWLY
ncbi:hypothetical protein [Gilvibacter sediminis]|uniref:hypothetical protein n=1 Tax=Gilvibacter sediminis TaxID=379071 RepID=UPI0023502B1E|nr:hypothetical protein [Gilvibacter sediminis]MDC7996888.1 hypothetical protein [Gilvibacter sediminis]